MITQATIASLTHMMCKYYIISNIRITIKSILIEFKVYCYKNTKLINQLISCGLCAGR